MKISFGLSLDGYEDPEQKSCIGEIFIGPAGFLDLLETRLGLSGQWPPQPLRVIQYQKCLSEAESDENTLFYSSSFAVDAFTVAETLLDWRDEWIQEGWDGTSLKTDSERIQAIAHVEKFAKKNLGMGSADRLRAVIKALKERSPGIDEVQLIDSLVEFPPVWQEILGELPVVKPPSNDMSTSAAPEGSDLAMLQNALSKNSPAEFTGDGSFIVVKAMNDYSLSRAIGDSFADAAVWGSETATVVCGNQGSVLDEGLQSSNLPISGQSSNSIWRPASQVLRLALSLYWQPLDPHRLLELLTHPVGPIRKSLRSRLANVVANAPGIGGHDWNEVISDVRTSSIERADGDIKAGNFVDEQVNTWLDIERFDTVDGAPTAKLSEHCAQVARWALTQANNPNIDNAQRMSFLNAQSQAGSAADTIAEMGRSGTHLLTKVQLDRLIDQVTEVGTGRPDIVSECNHLHVIGDPASAIKSVERVVWWDFSAPNLPKKLPWRPEEIVQLRTHGCRLPDIDAMLQFAAKTWMRPVMAAKKQLIIVMPKFSGSETVIHHPLWDQILMISKDTEIPEVDIDLSLENSGSLEWLVVNTDTIKHHGLPKQRRWWQLNDGELLGNRDFESYSSLDNFINKPHIWVLRYKARLSAGSLENIAEDNRQKGILLHHLVEIYFTSTEVDWKVIDEGLLRKWIDIQFPMLLAREGANYLLPGKKQAEEKLRSIAVSSIWALTNYLRNADVITVSVEKPVEGRFKGGKLSGSIDLLVSRADKKEAVVDLKWSSLKYKKIELSENMQLQLATYAVMQRDVTNKLPDQAYFIIDEGRMLAQNKHYFADAEEIPPKGESDNSLTLWDDFQETWVWRRGQIDKGTIELTVEGTEPDENSKPPQDSMKIKDSNNRFDDYVTLTGWSEEA